MTGKAWNEWHNANGNVQMLTLHFAICFSAQWCHARTMSGISTVINMAARMNVGKIR